MYTGLDHTEVQSRNNVETGLIYVWALFTYAVSNTRHRTPLVAVRMFAVQCVS